jgi:hypothetical protein
VATRFYLHASGSQPAPNNPAFDAGWEQTGQAVRLPMDSQRRLEAATTLADASAVTVPITTTQQILGAQFTSRQVFKPARLGTDVLFSMVLRGLENATNNNAHLAYVLRAFAADGSTSLGTLVSSMTTATEFVATAATRIHGNGSTTVALTATTLSEPWRLVIDIGAHAQAPGGAGSFTYRYGCSAATDFALTSALTTDLNPWIELSADLDAVRLNNYHGARVGSGMGTTDRVR